MLHWQPNYDNMITIKAVLAGHPIYRKRITQWKRFYNKYGFFPSILLTEGGWMVNGHHRLLAAREKSVLITGQIVERQGKAWIATGNTCFVK